MWVFIKVNSKTKGLKKTFFRNSQSVDEIVEEREITHWSEKTEKTNSSTQSSGFYLSLCVTSLSGTADRL